MNLSSKGAQRLKSHAQLTLHIYLLALSGVLSIECRSLSCYSSLAS